MPKGYPKFPKAKRGPSLSDASDAPLQPGPGEPVKEVARYALTEKQEEANAFLAAPGRHKALFGGARSGKTFLFVRAICNRALMHGASRHAILRLRQNAVRSAVALDTFPKVMRLCFPDVAYEEHRIDGFFEFPHNDSQIWMGGLDDKERVEKILGQEYCVDLDAKVLTADLRWVPAKDLVEGQELIGFPENLDGHCKLVPSFVENAEIIQADKYRVVTDKGDTIVSADHRFVAHYDDRRHKNFRQFSWRKTTELRAGDKIRFTVSPWDVGEAKEDGWFAGMLDGEGSASKQVRAVQVAQCEGVCLQDMRNWLRRNSIEYIEYLQQSSKTAVRLSPPRPCKRLQVCGLWPSLRTLGIARPKRLDYRIWEGSRAFRNAGHDAVVLRIEPLGRGPVVSMQTTTKTFIADGFLAHNCTIFLNECSQIPYSSVLVARTRLAQVIKGLTQRMYYDLNPSGKAHWSNQEFGLKKDPISRQPLKDPENYARMQINPPDNKVNLSQEYLDSLDRMPEKQRRRFFLGEYIDEVDGALWSYDRLDAVRLEITEVPPLMRIVVAVDPSGARGPEDTRSDEIGICVAGKGYDGRAYVLEDLTCRLGPAGWARVAVNAYHRWQADCVVAETNFGKAMVEETIRSVDATIPFRALTASRGKAVRAEPVAALYEERIDLVRHVGRLPDLEDQLCAYSVAGYAGDRSPDRADAMIWALSDLMIGAGQPQLLFG